ncbi:hypothetical protein [Streptomyces sp. SID1034]|uniref:hypothetical protein n=1 Tax=Streptomyces TaxID=1883 RepID=UPI0013697C41|nr:hypothetical protein [Streptomyces sp. SID1034]MYV90375.1 hypothetical protein [Streptomyces sp. SID1034]
MDGNLLLSLVVGGVAGGIVGPVAAFMTRPDPREQTGRGAAGQGAGREGPSGGVRGLWMATWRKSGATKVMCAGFTLGAIGLILYAIDRLLL